MSVSKAFRFLESATMWIASIVAMWLFMVYGMSASFWYTPHVVFVNDAVVGDVVVMNVSRTVKRPFQGRFEVTVRSLPELTSVCNGTGSHKYSPHAELNKVVTLEWWADGPMGRIVRGRIFPRADTLSKLAGGSSSPLDSSLTKTPALTAMLSTF